MLNKYKFKQDIHNTELVNTSERFQPFNSKQIVKVHIFMVV